MSESGSILIVDDNVSLCKTLSFVLRRKGYAVSTAKKGLEALELFKERPFDMVLMDIKMPVMNGVETYRKLKKVRSEACVVMMTAYAVEELVNEALEEGAYGIVYKPLDIEKVVSLINEVRAVRRSALMLVVDDDPATCTTLRNILVEKGFEAVVAGTGEEAIAVAKERAYDIIFISMKLPTINGLETYLTIREVDPEVVVIVMTHHQKKITELVEEALNNNAYACLYKPLLIDELLMLVGEIMEKKRKVG